MSSQRFETFLARLYSDGPFLQRFLLSPDLVVREAGLDPREQRAAIDIDKAGLLMAARSYEHKRAARRGGRSRWAGSAIWRLLWPAPTRGV
jgi:hypothetical protein